MVVVSLANELTSKLEDVEDSIYDMTHEQNLDF
eukprot:COSAG04_NODE_26287_length_297_cov_0.434343_1_plen_32_part_10